MKNPVRRRAFYTLMRCIAALALCTAFSLAVLLPAGRARVVTVGGVAAVMQLPGKLARGSELPLAVLCGPGEKFAPLAAALARRGVACVRLDEDVTADETAAVTAHMQTAYGTGRVVLAAYGKAGAMACGYPGPVGGMAALLLREPEGADGAALREAGLPVLLVYEDVPQTAPARAELTAAVLSLPDGQVMQGDDVDAIAETLCRYLM